MNFIKDLDACEEAVRRDPASAGAWLDVAAARLQNGRLEEALAASREAARLRPDWADALISVGFSCLVLGRGEEAREAFGEALRLDESQPFVRYGLAQSAILLRDWATALEHVKALSEVEDFPPHLVARLVASIEEDEEGEGQEEE